MLTRSVKFVFVFIALISTSLWSGPYEAEQAGMSQDRLDRIAPALSKYVASGALPGLITAIARKGEVVHFEVQGFADLNKIIKDSFRCLVKGGRIFVEHSPEQSDLVEEFYIESNYTAIEVHKDLNGDNRVSSGIKE